ncbi:hypothetical protein TNIN_217021 [Trichonephila inaurata madagascariensis]|uniref:Uncharacterized protein n=1 Tax=Trichonephila inaurata madagascariensis TaxID=2747483 RepID=A0A8X7CNM0_9ARAC|nr:hypothetical protein TNIN_217021 [Trichonephila inaurata madagascariensis]
MWKCVPQNHQKAWKRTICVCVSAGSASRSSAGEDGVGDAGAGIVTAAAGAGCGRMQWTCDGGVKCGKSSV